MKRTMNTTKYLGLTSMLLLAACQAEEITPERPVFEVQVSVDAPAKTRVNMAGDGFNSDDNFKLYLTGRPDENATSKTEYTYNGTNWNPDMPLYWDNQAATPFCAVSPIPAADGYVIGAAGKDTCSVKDDQSKVSDYILSDLLIARSTASERLININFQHAFCRVVVKIVPDSTFNATEEFKNAVVKLNSRYIKGEIEYPDTEGFTAKAVTAITSEYHPTNITMHKVSNKLEYAAIIPQQNVTLSGSAILVTISKVGTLQNTYTYAPKEGDLKLTNGSTTLTQGKQTTITINLKKTGVTGDITIVGWTDHVTGDGGDIVLPKNVKGIL